MMLLIRMILYAVSAGAAGYGLAQYDPAAGTITVEVDALAQMIGGAITFMGTFWASRIAKARGGKT